jgi:hypothetical protein
MHKVPHLCIASWDGRNKLYAFIPALYTDRRSSVLSQQEQKLFYEEGLRIAVHNLSPLSAEEWPATYSDEMFRARGHKGQLSFTTKMLGSWEVPNLATALTGALAEGHLTRSWAKGIVFLHQIRGVKHANGHEFTPAAALLSLRTFLEDNHLNYADLIRDKYAVSYVDVGLETSSAEDKCVAWRTDRHRKIVKESVEIPDASAARITKPGSSKYARDIVSHLPAVSGCRISTGRANGPLDIVYLQMYTTDKALTYRPDGRHYGKYLTGRDLLQGKGPEFIDNLIDLYNHAIHTNSSHARIEVRVALAHAADALFQISDDHLRDSLVSFPRYEWW